MYVPWASSSVEAGVDAGAAAKNSRPGIKDAVGGDEHLWGGGRRGVGQGDVEVLHERHVRVCEGHATPLQQQNTEALRQRRRQWAARRAAAHYYIIISLVPAATHCGVRGGGGGRRRGGVWASVFYEWVFIVPEILPSCNNKNIYMIISPLQTRSDYQKL